MEIQLVLLLTPVQLQPLAVVTATDCDPPAASTLCVVGATVYTHAPACVTVTVTPAIVSVPVRGLAEVLAATVKLTVKCRCHCCRPSR